jgi:hypothetical protein
MKTFQEIINGIDWNLLVWGIVHLLDDIEDVHNGE